MSYMFNGIFTNALEEDVSIAQEVFPGLLKVLPEPYHGIGVYINSNDYIEPKSEVAQQMIEKSVLLPNSIFVYMRYVCWGGAVDSCKGYAFQNGNIINGTEKAGEDEKGERVMRELLEIVGFKLDANSYFAPFQRGFFAI